MGWAGLFWAFGPSTFWSKQFGPCKKLKLRTPAFTLLMDCCVLHRALLPQLGCTKYNSKESNLTFLESDTSDGFFLTMFKIKWFSEQKSLLHLKCMFVFIFPFRPNPPKVFSMASLFIVKAHYNFDVFFKFDSFQGQEVLTYSKTGSPIYLSFRDNKVG